VPRNIRPKVDAGPDAVIKKGATFSSAGSFTDLCSPSWTATVDYGDGSGAQPLPLNANMTFGLSHVYANDGLYAVTVRVTDNGGLTGSDMALVLVDGTLPACSLTAVIAGPPKQLQITGRDAGSGLQSIVVLQSTNADTVVPPFVAGTTGPVVVTATKIDQTFGSIVRLRVIDRAGNATECDPVATLVVREAGMPVSQTFGGIPQAESQVTIMNGSPGVTNLQVGVNGKRFAVAELKDGESRTIDVSSAMVAGNDNTVTLEARGRPGGGADVVIHD